MNASAADRIRRCVSSEDTEGHPLGDYTLDGLPNTGPDGRSLTPAAVLIPVVLRPDGETVLLTQRTAHLEHHAGQISFPGGQAEKEDASPVETALREAEEEIGLSRTVVDVVGFLNPYITITGFLVKPVVGLIRPPFDLQLNTFEVAEAFEVPLAFLLDAQHHQTESVYFQNGQHHHYYVIRYQHRRIWGATAAMLVHFARRFAEKT